MIAKRTALALGAALLFTPSLTWADGSATTGRIYFIRQAKDAIPFPVPVKINGAVISDIGQPGTCTYLDLAPGTYQIHAMSIADLPLDLAAGETKFVMLTAHEKAIDGNVDQDQLVPELADGSAGAACAPARK